nr:Like-Sm ribonucleoprotein domain containing protein [Haemonchus contortus]
MVAENRNCHSSFRIHVANDANHLYSCKILRSLRQSFGKMTSVGVPIKILHEAEGHVVTLETVTGEVYRGKLLEAEDNMNCQMAEVCVTFRDGRTHQLDNVFVRGNKIRFMILPDMLKNAPMFKNIGRAQKGAIGMGMGDNVRGGGRGGRGTSFRARGAGMARGGARGAVRGGPGGFRG